MRRLAVNTTWTDILTALAHPGLYRLPAADPRISVRGGWDGLDLVRRNVPDTSVKAGLDIDQGPCLRHLGDVVLVPLHDELGEQYGVSLRHRDEPWGKAVAADFAPLWGVFSASRGL